MGEGARREEGRRAGAPHGPARVRARGRGGGWGVRQARSPSISCTTRLIGCVMSLPPVRRAVELTIEEESEDIEGSEEHPVESEPSVASWTCRLMGGR